MLAYNGNNFTSVNAFNLWALWPGMGISDGGLYILGWILFGILTAFVCYFLYKRLNDAGDFFAFFCTFMLFFGFFMLPTRIHERYMFPAIAVLALMVPFAKRARPLYTVLTATLLINVATILFSSFIFSGGGIDFNGYPFVIAVSVVNLVMLGYALFVLWSKRTWLKPESSPSLNETKEPKINGKQSKNKAINSKIISIVLMISGVLGVADYLIMFHNLLVNYDFLFMFHDTWLSVLLFFSCSTLFIGSYIFTINKK